MLRGVQILAVSAVLMSVACNGSQSDRGVTVTGPAPVSADVVYDTSVAWSSQLGRVTVTNPRSTPLTLTFILWRYISEENQIALAAATYTLRPGEALPLTVGLHDTTCGLVQRDLYEGVFTTGATMSDVRNFLYAGGGVLPWNGCGDVASVPLPQPDPCAQEALTLTVQPRKGLGTTGSVIATFNIGPAVVAWGDGASEPIFSGRDTPHTYADPNVKTVTVTTASECHATVKMVF